MWHILWLPSQRCAGFFPVVIFGWSSPATSTIQMTKTICFLYLFIRRRELGFELHHRIMILVNRAMTAPHIVSINRITATTRHKRSCSFKFRSQRRVVGFNCCYAFIKLGRKVNALDCVAVAVITRSLPDHG